MKRIPLIALCVLALAASPAAAARSDSDGMFQFHGDWHPVVGNGAVYQIDTKGQKQMTMEVAVVGQEAGGYWIENLISAPEKSIMKMLISQGKPRRMIVKAEGQPAMEMPVQMMQGEQAPRTDLKSSARKIGTEQITTPAGTFSCDHYQTTERGGTVDAWVATSVSPYGLVKMTSPGTTMTLAKVVKGAKSRITETPQQLPQMPSIAELMGQRE